MCLVLFIPPDPPTVNIICHSLSEVVSGAVNVTVSWTLSGGDSADFYLISISTNASQTPHGGLLNITTASITQYELTGFMAGYEYNITVHGVNCGSQEGSESEPLTITPQGMYICETSSESLYIVMACTSHNIHLPSNHASHHASNYAWG